MNFFLCTTATMVGAFLVISVIFWNLFQTNSGDGESCSLWIYMYDKFIVVTGILQCLVTINTLSMLSPADNSVAWWWLAHYDNLETYIIFGFIFCLLLYPHRVIRNHFCEDLHEDFFSKWFYLEINLKLVDISVLCDCMYYFFFCLFKLLVLHTSLF